MEDNKFANGKENSSPPARISKAMLFVYIASALMFVTMTVLTVWNAVAPFLGTNIAVMAVNIALWLVPFIFKPIFKDKISDSIYVFFVIYAFIASFLGSVLQFSAKITGYDKVLHFAFGYVGSVIGLFFVCKLSDAEKARPVYVVFVCVATSLALALLWEIFEFSGDMLFGNNAQGVPILGEDGNYYRPVTDTMYDVICNTGGAIVFLIHYVIHVCTKKSLLLGAMKKDFSKGKKTEKDAAPAPQTEE